MYNCHSHTSFSADSTESIYNVINAGINANLKGLAITDHACLLSYVEDDSFNQLSKCREVVLQEKQRLKDKINLFFGIEISENLQCPKEADILLAFKDIDLILTSIHASPLKNNKQFQYYSKQNYATYTKEEIDYFVDYYFDALLQTATCCDYDILAHLTLPIRYLNRFGVEYNLDRKEKVIIDILSTVIKREKALEVNTSTFKVDKTFIPNDYYIKMFKSLGGKYITLGSDSHKAQFVDSGLSQGKELIKNCGFTEYYYYQNRKPVLAEKL